MAREPDPSLIDDENPGWTKDDFARARPAREVLAPEVYAEVTRPKAGAERVRAKVAVTLQIDREVLEAFQADGPGWQARINAALSAAIGEKRSSKAG